MGCSHATPKTHPRPKVASAPKNAALPQHPETARLEDKETRSAQDPSIYFAFDSSQIAYGAESVLHEVGAMEKTSGRTVRVEGNCDERGTTEYNLALGDKRARAAAEYLQHLGVSKNKIEVVSFGSERPKSPGHNENPGPSTGEPTSFFARALMLRY